MRRIICVLLAVSVLLSFAVPSFAVESEEPQFGSINVEYSDSYGSIEQLEVMVQDGHVYANADVLSDRLGYRFEQNDNVFSIYAVSNILNQAAPLLAVHFRINSTDVSYNPLFGAEYKYTAPAPCVENDNGIWVPLSYTLVILGGNSTLLEDTLLIQMPQDNVLSVAAMIAQNDTLLSFDWVDDFGYSETTTNITNGAGRIVTLFSGLLEFDGAAWLSLVDWDAFDRKFGKSLVTMLCSRSQDELDEGIWQVEAMLDLLSDDGKLGEMLRNKQIRIDGDVSAWQTACENYLKMMEDGSGSPAKYNLLYRQCERAMDKQKQFAALGGEGMIQIQDALSSATNVLDIASIMGEAVSYMTEFQQTDEYLFAVLENYLNRRTETDYLPDATAQAMEHYLRVMDLGTLGYSAYSYIEKNWLKCIVDESGLDALLGAPANALLFTWDIMSETIPFYSEGLDAVKNREISNYAQKMQNDALENLNSLLSDLKYNTAELSAADCVQLSEYCYVYLKASYIARAMAIKSLENTSDEFQKEIKSKLDSETELNQKIAVYLSVLISANADNECYILGFLPENNEQYLNDYSAGSFSNILLRDAISFGDQSENSEKQLASIVVTENGGKTREITLDYDEKGRISEITDRYLGEAGEPDSLSVERYAYDAKGNLTRQESEYPDFTYIDEYVYDSHGNLVTSTIQDPGGWSNNTYEYNSKGQLIRITEKSQIYTRVTEYAYNSDGVRTGEAITYEESGFVWVVDCTYEYNSEHRLAKIVKVSPEGTETDFYEYDAQGREIKMTTETPWNTTYRTLDYDYSPFVIQQYEGGETYLMLDVWSLWLGDVKINTDENGFLLSAEHPEIERIYLFYYDGNSPQESTPDNAEDWKDLYTAYIEKNQGYFFDIYDSYTIAYVDDDDIPEILLTSSSAMPGAAILWISEGVVKEKSQIGYGSIHYYEKKGLVCTSWMNHGSYADAVYTLSDGEFTRLHMGRIYEDGSYEWDDQSVTREQYDTSLCEVFDRAIALEVNYDASVDTLIANILNWN